MFTEEKGDYVSLIYRGNIITILPGFMLGFLISKTKK